MNSKFECCIEEILKHLKSILISLSLISIFMIIFVIYIILLTDLDLIITLPLLIGILFIIFNFILVSVGISKKKKKYKWILKNYSNDKEKCIELLDNLKGNKKPDSLVNKYDACLKKAFEILSYHDE